MRESSVTTAMSVPLLPMPQMVCVEHGLDTATCLKGCFSPALAYPNKSSHPKSDMCGRRGATGCVGFGMARWQQKERGIGQGADTHGILDDGGTCRHRFPPPASNAGPWEIPGRHTHSLSGFWQHVCRAGWQAWAAAAAAAAASANHQHPAGTRAQGTPKQASARPHSAWQALRCRPLRRWIRRRAGHSATSRSAETQRLQRPQCPLPACRQCVARGAEGAGENEA